MDNKTENSTLENSTVWENLVNKDNILTEEKKVDYVKEIFDFWKDLLIIIILVLVIRTFFVIPFKISGSSMDSSYYDKEFIIVDRFSYLDIPVIKSWTPKRWDVIVFEPHVGDDRKYYIKRIIWLPWDKVKIEKWRVYIFDKQKSSFVELNETYLWTENRNSTFVWSNKSDGEFEVPVDWYFVMWDNRNHSTDSRECFKSCSLRWPYIEKSDIIWKVWLDLWYYNWLKEISFKPFSIQFWNFEFIHPDLWIDTHPRWFGSPREHDYK